jgi:hypothetical protein
MYLEFLSSQCDAFLGAVRKQNGQYLVNVSGKLGIVNFPLLVSRGGHHFKVHVDQDCEYGVGSALVHRQDVFTLLSYAG